MERCLQEFRIRGVKTNIPFLHQPGHAPAVLGRELCTTRFIDETPELFDFTPRRDRATKLLTTGRSDRQRQPACQRTSRASVRREPAPVPRSTHRRRRPPARATSCSELGAEKFCQWIREQKPLLMTDTTFRDAHQSLLATRVRTYDLLRHRRRVCQRLPATVLAGNVGRGDVRHVDAVPQGMPWQRLTDLREQIPNILFQMLLRASNAVGYTNYPDNVVRRSCTRRRDAGIDVFRIFDSLNWVPNMRVAMEPCCKPAQSASGDLLHGRHPRPEAARSTT